MKKTNGKPLQIYLRFKEDLPERREDALWEQFFEVLSLFDSEPGEDVQKGENIVRTPRKQAKLG